MHSSIESRPERRWHWVALGACVAAVFVADALGIGAGRAAPGPRTCVGVFVSGDRRTIAADSTALTVTGTVPCRQQVAAWSTQGVYRAFDDGSVELLATPVPPCPEGDFYVWIRYPNP